MFATQLYQHQIRRQRHTAHLNRFLLYWKQVTEQNARLNWQRENAIEARRLEECRLAMQAAGYRVVETPFS